MNALFADRTPVRYDATHSAGRLSLPRTIIFHRTLPPSVVSTRFVRVPTVRYLPTTPLHTEQLTLCQLSSDRFFAVFTSPSLLLGVETIYIHACYLLLKSHIG